MRVRAIRRTLGCVLAVGLAALVALGSTANAQGGPVGGYGAEYYLNDQFTGIANTVFTYGEKSDEVHVGDWNGDRIDTLLVRRNTTFFARNSNTTGTADVVFSYGNPGDVVLTGDWNGDGTDTLAVRRGNVFFVKNSVSTGVADEVFAYGDPGDVVLVGDWNGDGTDTLAVRRGALYYVKDSITTGVADYVFAYGNPADVVLVGDWNGDRTDTMAVRRGNTYFLRNSTTTGVADIVFAYGNPSDTAFAGDWNGDSTDTLGVRRAPVPVTPPGAIPFDAVINKMHPYSPLDLVPTDLTTHRGRVLSSRLVGDLDAMITAASSAGASLTLESTYRSYWTQKSLYDSRVAASGVTATDLTTARPGYSEHQSGLAIDFGAASGQCRISLCFATTPEGRWLSANSYRFGFVLRYPDGHTSTTGYSYEPWHFRYIGPDAARDMHARGTATLEEYFGVPGGTSY